MVYGCLNRTDGHFPGLRTNASLFNTGDRRPTASVYQPRLRLERPRVPSVARAESRPGSRLRPGEQLVISAATLENRACSPGRPLCPVQEGANGGTARQGEQLVISAATLENRASSPSRPSRPAQTLWKKALVEELGAVFGSRVPVRKAAERPSQRVVSRASWSRIRAEPSLELSQVRGAPPKKPNNLLKNARAMYVNGG